MGLPFYQVVAFPGGAALVGAWLPSFRRERSKGNLSFLPRGSLEGGRGRLASSAGPGVSWVRVYEVRSPRARRNPGAS
jgi:hypothetical protein